MAAVRSRQGSLTHRPSGMPYLKISLQWFFTLCAISGEPLPSICRSASSIIRDMTARIGVSPRTGKMSLRRRPSISLA